MALNQPYYPRHISDPVRLYIATQLIQKELIKLFPSLTDACRNQINQDVANWNTKSSFDLTPIRDFWNGAEGILGGFKSKNIVRFLTAENIVWKEQKVPIEKLTHWAKVDSPIKLQPPPYSAAQLREIFKVPAIHQYYKDIEDKTATNFRNAYPIITLKTNDTLTILDGNRRMRRAVFLNKSSINSYVGSYTSSTGKPINYWISNIAIKELLFTLVESQGVHSSSSEIIKNILKYWVNNNETARINFNELIQGRFKGLDVL